MASIDCRGGDTVAVLLHGFLGDRRDVAPLQRVLASRLPCVSIDLPGHGDTPRLGQQAGGALEAVEASLEELCSRGCKGPVCDVYMHKLLLHIYLPRTLRRVIFLDSDVVLRDDVRQLWRQFELFGPLEAIGLAEEQNGFYSQARGANRAQSLSADGRRTQPHRSP